MKAQTNISPATIEAVRRYREDFKHHASKCIFIRDHNTAKIVNLNFNKGQQILHAVAEKMLKQFGYVRLIFLKSRRFGGSTYVQGRFYSKTSTRSNRNTFIAAHENESTKTLFGMAKLMQQKNPLAPQTKHSNERALLFDTKDGNGLKSEYRVTSAKNTAGGRSQGIHYLHISEEAFWPDDGEDLLNGLFQCLPDPPAPHECFRESTANGYGNTFQRAVWDAYQEGSYPYYEHDGITYAWKNPRSDWVLVFIPWFVHERYKRDFIDDDEKNRFAGKIHEKVFESGSMEWRESEALRLRKRYGLSLEQLHWREWAIENKIEAPSREERERMFKQEYPSNVEEAFLSRGANCFSKELCDDLEEFCEKPIAQGEVIDRAGKSRIKLNRYGKFKLWEKPEKNETYFMTIDAGGGLKPSQEAENREPDPTCIDVYNHRTGVQCAQWNGHVPYGQIADVAYLIGRMYDFAPACVELMNHGFTVVNDLSEMNYPLFEAKPGEPGWLTNKVTKPRMIDDLEVQCRNGDLKLRCRETVSEMRTFVEKNGKFEAESGCHDDRVIAAAMASQMMTLMPKRFKQMRGKDKPVGFANFKDRYKPERNMDYQEVHVA